MRIGLIDVDGNKFPNLALMKLSAYHKSIGDDTEMWNGLVHYDKVYQSKIFTNEYTPDLDFCVNADVIVKGGTGYGLHNKLPDEVEHMMPDYSLYNVEDTAYGFLSRGCPRACGFCIVSEKEGRKSVRVADLKEFWNGQKNIELLDPNLLACRDHEDLLKQIAESKAKVNFNSGLDARFLTMENIDLINQIRVKNIHYAWDFLEQEDQVMRGLKMWKEHGKHRPSGKHGGVYVLTNFNTTHEEDLYRVEKLKSMRYDPYVMIYMKNTAPKETRWLQRYVNNKFIFWSSTWEEYLKTRKDSSVEKGGDTDGLYGDS